MVTPSLKHLPPGFQKIGGRLIHRLSLPGLKPSGPTLIFLHGIASTGSSWLPLIHALRRRASRFVIFDLPGHGLSAPADENFTFETAYAIARDIVIHEAEPESRNILIGNSLGGAFAMKISLECPDLVTRTILISPAGAPFPTSARDVLDPFLPHTLGETKRLLDTIFVRPGFRSHILAPQVYYTTTRPGFRAFIRSMLAYDTDEDAPVRRMIFRPQDLASCRVPVQLIWGKQDHVLPAAMRDFYDTHLPDACPRLFPETFGHCPQFEEPSALAKLMML